jgi:hypothetical protein
MSDVFAVSYVFHHNDVGRLQTVTVDIKRILLFTRTGNNHRTKRLKFLCIPRTRTRDFDVMLGTGLPVSMHGRNHIEANEAKSRVLVLGMHRNLGRFVR